MKSALIVLDDNFVFNLSFIFELLIKVRNSQHVNSDLFDNVPEIYVCHSGSHDWTEKGELHLPIPSVRTCSLPSYRQLGDILHQRGQNRNPRQVRICLCRYINFKFRGLSYKILFSYLVVYTIDRLELPSIK